MNVLAQIIGLIASAMNILSYQMKDNKRLYLCQFAGGALFALNFLLLGSYTAALLNLVNLVRCGILAAGKKWTRLPFFLLVEGLYILSCVLTYDGWLSLLVTGVQLISTVAMFKRSGKMMRIVQFCVSSPAWLIHNILVFSLGGILTEVITMGSIILSIIRFGINGFTDEPEKN